MKQATKKDVEDSAVKILLNMHKFFEGIHKRLVIIEDNIIDIKNKLKKKHGQQY